MVAEEEWVCFDCCEVKHDEGSRAVVVVTICIFHGGEAVSSGVEETVVCVGVVYRFSDGSGAVEALWSYAPVVVEIGSLGGIWHHP